MTINESKIKKDVPCLYLKWNEHKQHDEIWAPAIECTLDCANCGFDPAEKNRRLETGKFVEEDGIRNLVFKRAKKKEEDE